LCEVVHNRRTIVGQPWDNRHHVKIDAISCRVGLMFEVRSPPDLFCFLVCHVAVELASCGVPGSAKPISSRSKIPQMPGLPGFPTFISVVLLCLNSYLTTLLNYTFAIPLFYFFTSATRTRVEFELGQTAGWRRVSQRTEVLL
jgi:hypothetical protein